MNRREYLKSLLGLGAAAALPVPLEALAEVVAMPGQSTGYTLEFQARLVGQEWKRYFVPIAAGSDEEAVSKMMGLIDGFINSGTEGWIGPTRLQRLA